MALKARHAFGDSSQVLEALKAGKINEYDILFLDGDTEPKIGWIDANGEFRLVESEADFSELETEIAKKANASDVEEVESKIGELETEVETKVSAEAVQTMIDDVFQVIEF